MGVGGFFGNMPEEMKSGSHLRRCFGNYYVDDKGYNRHHFLIHDYFIAKMIDQASPCGLVAVITSKGTLDKQNSRARKYFARHADLVKAIRLQRRRNRSKD